MKNEQVYLMELNGVGSQIVKSDYGQEMGLNILDVVTGKTSLTEAISGAVYDEAMKLVQKNADIVKTFANKAVSQANIISAQLSAINVATDPGAIETAYVTAKKAADQVKVEASNAAKNYTVTVTSMTTLKKIPGIPTSVIGAADAIIAGAKSSLDKANNAVTAANNAFPQVQSIYDAKAGISFLPGVPASFLKDYGIYLVVGGVALVGIIAMVMMRRGKSSSNSKESGEA